MGKVKEPVIFSIKKADIGAFLAGDKNLSPNSGSAKECLRALRIITQPDLYLVVRVAGAQGLSEIRLHHKKSEGDFVAATEENGEVNLTISLFDDYKSWLTWWAEGFASQSDQPAANYIPPKVSFEEFMFVLHAVDSFRRVSYQNMLDHVFMEKTYIKVPEFLRSMADSLKSMDIRWLLPAFLAVTPGVEQYQTEIDPQNIGVLLQQDFFSEGKLASGEDVLIFGEAGQIMGVEFFRSWFTSCGVEINAAGPDGFKAVERLFIAPTLLGSHFVRLEGADNGRAMVNHQLYNTEQLVFKLEELFDNAFAGAVHSPVAPLSSVISTPPAKEFCSSCGSKVSAEAVFCGNCGTKLK